MAFKFDGHLDDHGFFVVNFEEIHVEDSVLDGVELDVLENGHLFAAVKVEFDSEDVGGVDEFAYIVLCHDKVGGNKRFVVADFNEFLAGSKSAGEGQYESGSSIEIYADFFFSTLWFGSLLAQIVAGLGL